MFTVLLLIFKFDLFMLVSLSVFIAGSGSVTCSLTMCTGVLINVTYRFHDWKVGLTHINLNCCFKSLSLWGNSRKVTVIKIRNNVFSY